MASGHSVVNSVVNIESLIQFNDEHSFSVRNHYASLVSEIQKCTKCELSKSGGLRDIGEGVIPADIMFVGEAFGSQEKDEGRPFCGDAGKFLRKRLSFNNITLSANHNGIKAFITNCIDCFPPPPEDSSLMNGKPSTNSLLQCKPYLWKKIKFCRPKLIVALGEYATKNLLSIPFEAKIIMRDCVGRAQEKCWKLDGTNGPDTRLFVIPLYHPSYVVRKGSTDSLIRLYDTILSKCCNYVRKNSWG